MEATRLALSDQQFASIESYLIPIGPSTSLQRRQSVQGIIHNMEARSTQADCNDFDSAADASRNLYEALQKRGAWRRVALVLCATASAESRHLWGELLDCSAEEVETEI